MILEWLLDMLEAVLLFIVDPLPDSTFTAGDVLSGWMGQLGALNYFLPIAETFALVLGAFVVFPALMGVSLALWVAAQIRGSSSLG